MIKPKQFYNLFHSKNKNFHKLIHQPNFTYYYHLKIFSQWLKNYPQLKVLDVGCGVAPLSLYLANKGADVTDIDISTRAIKIAKQAAKDLRIKLTLKAEQLKTGKQQYNFIICSEVLEHIKAEDEFLKKLKSNLKKDGLVFLSVPSSENILYQLGRLKKFDQQVGHLRRYSAESIQKKLKQHGFKILQIQKTESPLRNLLFTSRLGFIIKFIRGPFIKIFHFVDELLIKIFGYCDIILVVKK